MNDFDTLAGLVGDTPVSEQISMAIKTHTHDDYATRDEVEELKKQLEALIRLVGDVPVSEQLNVAICNALRT